jgi:cbb3-type cytochrome oxidase subunit 3
MKGRRGNRQEGARGCSRHGGDSSSKRRCVSGFFRATYGPPRTGEKEMSLGCAFDFWPMFFFFLFFMAVGVFWYVFWKRGSRYNAAGFSVVVDIVCAREVLAPQVRVLPT